MFRFVWGGVGDASRYTLRIMIENRWAFPSIVALLLFTGCDRTRPEHAAQEPDMSDSSELTEEMLYDGISVDISFAPPGPKFGDLFQICGFDNPNHPPSGKYRFDTLANLHFTQVDDYFGIRSDNDVGDDVVVWLFPLVNGKEVFHHSGPFDAVRLKFSVLWNPMSRADDFYRCIDAFASLGTATSYVNRGIDLGTPPSSAPIREDIESIINHWRAKGIEVGSDDALELEY